MVEDLCSDDSDSGLCIIKSECSEYGKQMLKESSIQLFTKLREQLASLV